MRIACLGWGSLVWDPRELSIVLGTGSWHGDGPSLPIEFARQSSRDRLTLVTLPEGTLVPTLWAEMCVDDIDDARSRLKLREGTFTELIGVWPYNGKYLHSEIIGRWATAKGIDAVIWTALGPKFNAENNRIATLAEAIGYLRSLVDRGLSAFAEEYVRKAPAQISTPFRSAFETEFGWTPIPWVAPY